MTKAMRSEMALTGVGFDDGANAADASAIGEAERRHITDPISGPRMACVAIAHDHARVAELLELAHLIDEGREFRGHWALASREALRRIEVGVL